MSIGTQLMKVDVEKQEKNLALINLEISAEQASQEYNKACKRLSQRINVPGFRRGKAPRPIIEKTIGAERIKQEALDRMLPHLFADAISEHQLDIVAPPQIESYKFDLNDGIQVKAQVELRPEATLPDLSSLSVEVPEFKLPADAQDKELQTILERMTTLEPVIDRPSEAADIVDIDFTGTLNGELIRGGSAKNYRLDLADNNFIEGFAPQLVGKKIGEEFSIKVTFPKDYHDNMLSGKEALFLVKINDIKRKVVPTLNDELAKKVGPFETVDQLKAELKKYLDEQVENTNHFRKQKALIEKVVSLSDVEIPDTMTNREAKLLMEEVKQRLKEQGFSWEQYLEAQGHEATWENLRKEAQQRIKTSLVMGAIAKKEALAVTEDEFFQQVKEMAESRNTDEKAIFRQLANNPNWAQSLNDMLLVNKIVDFLTERTTFTFVPDTGENADDGKQSVADVLASSSGIVGGPSPASSEAFETVQEE